MICIMTMKMEGLGFREHDEKDHYIEMSVMTPLATIVVLHVVVVLIVTRQSDELPCRSRRLKCCW